MKDNLYLYGIIKQTTTMKVYIASGFEFWYDRSAKGYISIIDGREVIVGKDTGQATFYLDWLSKNTSKND